jgi:hypothetical protein
MDVGRINPRGVRAPCAFLPPLGYPLWMPAPRVVPGESHGLFVAQGGRDKAPPLCEKDKDTPCVDSAPRERATCKPSFPFSPCPDTHHFTLIHNEEDRGTQRATRNKGEYKETNAQVERTCKEKGAKRAACSLK